MAWVLLSMVIVSCVRLGEGEGIQGRFADVSAFLMDGNHSSGTPSNTFHMKGAFGKFSLPGPVTGQLVHVRSEGNVTYGCQEYNHEVPPHPWVALIKRGNCKFSQKVHNATKRYNAAAVIVYDNQPSDELRQMKVSEKNEVYVFVSQPNGTFLAQLVDKGLNVQVNIAAKHSSASYFRPLFACPILSSLFVAMTHIFRQF